MNKKRMFVTAAIIALVVMAMAVTNASASLCGDVNDDGYVDMTDVMMVQEGTVTNEWAADVNCDGVINTTDAMIILDAIMYPGAYELNCCEWYWKDYNGEEDGGYMPDFDQNQDFDLAVPGIEQNYCAPTAEANSLWWFAQKYPDREVVPPGATPQDLIQELAWLMDTNGQRTEIPHNGTYVDDEQAGVEDYLIQHGLTDLLYEHTELEPEFEWIEAEIERCQDVKLDLGFYEVIDVVEIEPGHWHIEWRRIGGHAVTAAGVYSENFRIAISDPDADNAEFGFPGIVRGPNHNHGGVFFHDPAYDHTQHNDGVSASHDIYNVTPSISPGGTWALTDPYWKDPAVAYWYEGNNGGTWINFTETYIEIPPEVGEVFTEIEAAVVVSPCIPAIEVNKTVWNGTAWVNEIDANVNDTVRFRLWVHNNGTCCNLTNITVVDILPDGLNYSGNAVPLPVFAGHPEIDWIVGPLAPCQNITIEFDAQVVEPGNNTNVVNVTAWRFVEPVVSDEDSANVSASVGGLPPVAIARHLYKYNNVGSKHLCKVYFNGSDSYDPDGVIVNWSWSFGDGNNSTGNLTEHVYQGYNWNGTGYDPFIASLTVTDNSNPPLNNTTYFEVMVYKAGDANGDGRVYEMDASIVGLEWGQEYGTPGWTDQSDRADLNNDGRVDILDALIVGAYWDCGDANDDKVVDMTDVMTVWYDFADYPYPGAYTITDEWAADVNSDGKIDMTDVMIIWYDFADYPYPGAHEVNCCELIS